MIKGSIEEEGIKIINIYAPNIGATQYVRQTLTSMKEEIMWHCKNSAKMKIHSITGLPQETRKKSNK